MQESNHMASAPPVGVTDMVTHTIPMFIGVLNRLARLGKASRYSQKKRLLQFDLADNAPLREKWIALADAERVSLIYWDPAEVRTVNRAI